MDYLQHVDLQEINVVSITIRLFLATVFGGLIGVERTRKQRAAGFRTHILVCIGATLAMMTNQYLVQELDALADPSRIGAQVISGIGFLGAGTILVTKQQEIRGLTTAAGLWASACMGLAIGIGFYEGAIIGFLYIWGVMTVLQRVDRMVQKRTKHIKLYIELENITYFDPLLSHFKERHEKIYDTQVVNSSNQTSTHIGLLMTIKISSRYDKKEAIKRLSGLEGIYSVKEL